MPIKKPIIINVDGSIRWEDEEETEDPRDQAEDTPLLQDHTGTIVGDN